MMKNSILLFFLAASTAGFGQVSLPIDFESTSIDYGFGDFAGTASEIITDPTDAGNKVVQTIRTAGSEVFAGTAVGNPTGFTTAIPFDAANTIMSVRIWSPVAGLPMRLKVENGTNGGINVETETISTVAMDWETVEFDFAIPTTGSPSLNFDLTYGKIVMFFNFGQPPASSVEQTFFWDDVTFVGGTGGTVNTYDLPIDFDGEPFGFNDFAGTATTIIVDPTDPNNMVGQTVRSNTAEVFAGTVPGGALANPVPFSAGNTTMSVRVWSPNANTPVRLKVETAGGGPGTETETITTVAMQWETLVFDFNNPAAGQPALDLNANYNQMVIFFNFGTLGSVAGEQTYYWDDLAFGGTVSVEDVSSNTNISVYPNPANDHFLVNFADGNIANTTLTLMDLAGRIVERINVVNGMTRVETNKLAAGQYILRIDTADKIYAQKVLVTK